MCGQPVSHSSLTERKQCRVMDCVLSVMRGRFHLSRVIICESKRDVSLTVLPSWLAWQAANIHLRHESTPCLRSCIHKLKAFFRRSKIKQRITLVSVWGRNKERMRRQTKNTKNAKKTDSNPEFLWHWIYISCYSPSVSYYPSNTLIWTDICGLLVLWMPV